MTNGKATAVSQVFSTLGVILLVVSGLTILLFTKEGHVAGSTGGVVSTVFAVEAILSFIGSFCVWLGKELTK